MTYIIVFVIGGVVAVVGMLAALNHLTKPLVEDD